MGKNPTFPRNTDCWVSFWRFSSCTGTKDTPLLSNLYEDRYSSKNVSLKYIIFTGGLYTRSYSPPHAIMTFPEKVQHAYKFVDDPLFWGNSSPHHTTTRHHIHPVTDISALSLYFLQLLWWLLTVTNVINWSFINIGQMYVWFWLSFKNSALPLFIFFFHI